LKQGRHAERDGYSVVRTLRERNYMGEKKTTMERTRLAVVGVGHLGKEHARILSGHPDVNLVGVVDSRPDQAETVAQRCGTLAF
jgi:hypothetical protein